MNLSSPGQYKPQEYDMCQYNTLLSYSELVPQLIYDGTMIQQLTLLNYCNISHGKSMYSYRTVFILLIR